MNRHAVYPVEEIFSLMDEASGAPFILPSGERMLSTNARYFLFYTKGADCVTCDAQGAFFALESQNGEKPHMNLYAVTLDGQVRLMTKDHIIPKSKGGLNVHENYQPMCAECNGQKADKI